jgi:hypothetical protein
MKTLIVRDGKIKTETGAFTGFTLKREKVHVHGKTLAAAAIPADYWIKDANGDTRLAPGKVLYIAAEVTVEQHGTVDAQGKFTAAPVNGEDTFERTTARVVCLDKSSLAEIMNEEKVLALEIEKDFTVQAQASGLSEAQLASLVLADL